VAQLLQQHVRTVLLPLLHALLSEAAAAAAALNTIMARL
jgi:hypothetical protein